ncbi:hypothetical protein K6M90_17120 [Rhizobium sp. 9T]|uniref:hypothetical protein n=1 Tax=Rhizobium croatiense TaxID=2867516 RepID=UPI001C935863|nr:hypothetical protein [Rhizobium croatiense]MBY4609370.1 hypothetical protein [Rhizobium croatiense]
MLNPSIRFSPSNVAALKKALRQQYSNIKSSHLDEAIAASFGFKSYAAMRPTLHGQCLCAVGRGDRSPALLLRLEELGYRNIPPEAVRRLVWTIDFPDDRYDNDVGEIVRARRRPATANAE